MPETGPNDVSFEKSPNYLTFKGVPERIYRADPNMLFVITIRDPVVR